MNKSLVMERKIGEIFEYDDEFFQCVESSGCALCAFNEADCNDMGCCEANTRSDRKSVIFKKLEKVGEPFADYCPSGEIIYFQRYKCSQKPIYNGDLIYCPDDNFISIEIKNKEDMKTVKISKDDLNFLINKIHYGILPKHIDYDKTTNEISKLFSIDNIEDSNSESIGKNLKPFDLEAAKSGKPVCTRDGRKVRIVCFDMENDVYPILALISTNNQRGVPYEIMGNYTKDGKIVKDSAIEHNGDLMMVADKKEGYVNIYKSVDTIFQTEEEAKSHKDDFSNYVKTIKIEMEE